MRVTHRERERERIGRISKAKEQRWRIKGRSRDGEMWGERANREQPCV